MAPTPYVAGGRMVMAVTVEGLVHEQHLACNPVEDVSMPSGYALVGNDAGDTPIDPQDAADEWAAIVMDMYATGVSAPAWTLEQDFGGVFVPVAAGVAAAAGSGGAQTPLCSVATITFKDQQNLRANFAFMETVIGVPYRHTALGDPSALGDFAVSMVLLDVVTPSLGGWVVSRGNNRINLARFISTTVSKRLRRIRGLL